MGNKVWLPAELHKDASHYAKGRVITSIEGMETGSEEVKLRFVDGGYITFYHSQGCCETVDLHDFYGEGERGVVLSFEERSNEAEQGEVSESGTWTFYSIQTTTGEIWMRWLGESSGYYSEAVNVVATNEQCVLVIDDAVPKLYVEGETVHDETSYVLAAEGQPGMSVEDMEKWLRMAAEVTKP